MGAKKAWKALLTFSTSTKTFVPWLPREGKPSLENQGAWVVP
jgi:hypothetical protein